MGILVRAYIQIVGAAIVFALENEIGVGTRERGDFHPNPPPPTSLLGPRPQRLCRRLGFCAPWLREVRQKVNS